MKAFFLFLMTSALLAQSPTPPSGLMGQVIPAGSTGGGGTVATPNASPGTGTYSGTQPVTLTTSTSGATICFTVSGSNPSAATPGTCDAGSTTYTTAVSISATTTLKALATKSGAINSSVATWTYTINSGTTRTASGCTSANIQTAASASADGDTIQCPSGGGSVTWSSSITISKGVTFNGNGWTVTLPSTDGTLTVNTDNANFSMTGFTFTGCNSGNGPIYIGLASGPPYNATPRLYNNTFNVGSICLEIFGLGPALIDHNTFTTSTQAAEMIHIWGGNAGSTTGWTVDITPGGPNVPYFENNVFTQSNTSDYAQAEEIYYGGSMVFRDNQLNYVQNDVHGTGSFGPESRWVEHYNNTYNNCCNSSSFFDFRGGSGMVWGNTANSTRSGTRMTIGPISGSSDTCTTYPITYDFGTGVNGASSSYNPIYTWGTSAVENNTPNNNCSQMAIISGASGSTTSCSPGLSFPGGNTCNVVRAGSTQPSSLLRCESAADVTAGCPVSYTYTPYTYPHSLDTCSASKQGSC